MGGATGAGGDVVRAAARVAAGASRGSRRRRSKWCSTREGAGRATTRGWAGKGGAGAWGRRVRAAAACLAGGSLRA